MLGDGVLQLGGEFGAEFLLECREAGEAELLGETQHAGGRDIGLAREDVYIANIIKCRPPGNRDPLPAEIESCKELLFAQIAIIQPDVLCTLGRHAAETLLAIPNFKISRDHGKPIKWQGISALPVFHPAAALHQPALKTTLMEDFGRLKQFLQQTEKPPTPKITPEARKETPPEQLSLF
mgnify:CR=1 FL=1